MTDNQIAEIVRAEIRLAAKRHHVKPSQVQDLNKEHRLNRQARAARVEAVAALKQQGLKTWQLAWIFDFAPNTITAMAREYAIAQSERHALTCGECGGSGQLQSGRGCDSPESMGEGHQVFAQCPECLGTGRADA